MARDNDAEAVVILSALPYDFAGIRGMLKDVRLVVATDKSDVMRAATEDGVDLVPLLHEPETRQVQLSQALLEAIADELLQTAPAMPSVSRCPLDPATTWSIWARMRASTSDGTIGSSRLTAPYSDVSIGR